MKISVLGCGRWGSFLAWYTDRLGNDVACYGRESSLSYRILKENRRNEYVAFADSIELTCDLEYAVARADVVIISLSAQSLRGFLKQFTEFDLGGKKFVLCMKGMEEQSGKRLSEVAAESGLDKKSVAVWLGPGHIQDFVKGIPNCMVIDSYDPALTRALADLFRSDLIRFYYGDDMIGNETGAAAKNVMGIVAGMLDGLGLASLKGPLMARGAREVSRLIAALGGNSMSAYGLCHLGDYETTLFSRFSHNRGWGEAYTKGENFSRLAEGVPTAAALARLSERVGVEMPITNAVYDMIRFRTPPMEVLSSLFGRNPKKEF